MINSKEWVLIKSNIQNYYNLKFCNQKLLFLNFDYSRYFLELTYLNTIFISIDKQ